MRNVVVGVDGTESARAALAWAARTVGPDGAVHAVTAAIPVPELGVDARGPAPLLDRIRGRLESDWTADVRHRVRELTTHVDAAPADEALEAARRRWSADAIVVGIHLPRRVGSWRLGRTLRGLLRDQQCPLIVVPDERRLDGDGPIVAGVGHGEATEAAVRWAADLAARTDRPLGLVRATGEGPVFGPEGLVDAVTLYIDPAQRTTWAREDVAEMARLAQAVTDRPLEIGAATVSGLPATQLVELSGRASLLVIGRHRSLLTGDRHIAQPLRHALTHAHCPLAVVPVATDR